MTENKRFDMIITSADGSFHYLDKNTGEKITSTLELENKLNELNNENEQLKHDASVLVQSNKDYRIENEQLKQQLSDIDGQLVMLDNCDNWDYDRMKHTVREIAEIIGYNGTINPKR